MVHLLLGVIYLAFISLGLPDSLLGSAWPSMYGPFGVPVSFAGIISMIIAVGTIVSSLNSDRLTARFGPGRVTACSVALTALALFGFSLSSEFWMLCLWAVPYGLGAGSVDAALNNYVALHYASRHMSWLHCMWGVGTLVGPNLISCALSGGLSAERAAALAALFYIGITAGRAVSGFVSGPLGDVRMIRLGQGIILAGAAALLLPSSFAMQAGLVLVGLGCAPIYPSIIHATPARFGAARSQALIGLEMAGAYVGTCLMPPLFGALSERLSISLMPLYLLALLAVMFLANERANRASGLVRSARPARERG